MPDHKTDNPPPILEINDVTIAYGGIPAVENVDIAVSKGEFFGLIGVNGAGKTTLIKSILGLRQTDGGEVRVMGQKITQSTTSRNLAFLPERFEPSWFLTGLEFLRFSTKIYGAKWTKQEYETYAERLALDPAVLTRRVQTYSKGMRQKLGILATVMTKSELLILDEPMSGLDPVARTRVKDLLLDFKKQGHTIFLSSHILADMDEICDRICLIHNKEAGFIGTPQALKEKTSAKNLERAFLHFIEERKVA